VVPDWQPCVLLFIAQFIVLPDILFTILEGIDTWSSGFPQAAWVCVPNVESRELYEHF